MYQHFLMETISTVWNLDCLVGLGWGRTSYIRGNYIGRPIDMSLSTTRVYNKGFGNRRHQTYISQNWGLIFGPLTIGRVGVKSLVNCSSRCRNQCSVNCSSRCGNPCSAELMGTQIRNWLQGIDCLFISTQDLLLDEQQ